MSDVYCGKPMDISGWVSDALNGAQRHPLDTNETIQLTLYGQDGEMQTLPVRRSRDMELFQEWLRRYDRYTPNPSKSTEGGGAAQEAPANNHGD